MYNIEDSNTLIGDVGYWILDAGYRMLKVVD